MAVLEEQPEPTDLSDPFDDLEGSTPLPTLQAAEHAERDRIATAERRISEVDNDAASAEAKVAARLELASAWLGVGGIANALEAARQANTIAPDDPRVLERLGELLARSGSHREAGDVYARLALASDQPAAWMAAGRSLARGEAGEALHALVEAWLSRARGDLGVTRFAVEVARALPGTRNLGERLLSAAKLARESGDAGYAARCALDAWVESHAMTGADLVAESVLSRGDGRGALLIAVDSAARLLAANDQNGGARLLGLAGDAARAIGDAATETAVFCAASLATTDASVRERARDLLSDAGRVLELGARLRADARREKDTEQAGAAWKGVAAVETNDAGGRAAAALGEALICNPADTEAREMLIALAERSAVEPSVRDALFWATRLDLEDRAERRELLVLLGDLERKAGDPAAALLAYSHAWKHGDQAVLTLLQAVSAEAETLFARADAALAAIETASRDDRATAVDAFLEAVGATPGAVRDLQYATKILASIACVDERVSAFWLKVIRRLGDSASLTSALRRIATRSTGKQARARAAIELAEMLDCEPSGQTEAVEVLQQLLDEQPGSVDAIAAMAAIAEHSDQVPVMRAALAAMAGIEPDAMARDALLRLAGGTIGATSPFALLTRALDDALAPRERSDALRDLIALAGESPALLARRTRSLLARTGEPEALNSARKFAQSVPLSPEATIAWFSAAGIAGEAEQLAEAALAVIHSLATARDAGSVARAAVARLFALDERTLGNRVAREAAEALGMADRSLRSALVEYAQQQTDPAVAIELFESAVAGALDAPGEQMAALRRVAQLHRSRGDVLGEAYALRRLIVAAPGDRDVMQRLTTLLPATGDDRALVRVLSLQLAMETDRSARRLAFLTLAALQAKSNDREAAILTLDRFAEEQEGPEAHSEAVRAMLVLQAPDAAVERLRRWADRSENGRIAALMYRAAARIVRRDGGDPAQMMSLLRSGLVREPESPEILILAEDIASESRSVRAMLEIYDDLDLAAAGEHGRRAIAYRRAAFLESAGNHEESLQAFLALFEKTPVGGALTTAIGRLAASSGRPEILVAMFRKLAENSVNSEGRIRNYLEASRVARELVHDRRAALELALLAHDVNRAESTSRVVIEIAHSLKSLDPQAFRGAVETVFERTISVADEVWDDVLKRNMAMRAVEISALELVDAAKTIHAVEVFFKGATEDMAAGRAEMSACLDRINPPASVREAIMRLESMRGAPAPAEPVAAAPGPAQATEESTTAARERVQDIAHTGDRAGALAAAVQALAARDDADLRVLAEELARDVGDVNAELGLLEFRLDHAFDNRQRVSLVLRVADLLRGPLARPADARRRLEAALANDPENDELVRGLHDVAEQLGAWETVASLLERRIARVSDRAETRALRLHRAAVLEQRMDDAAGARAELNAILEDEPAHRPALRYLADLHLRENQYQEAGECFARAATTTPVRAEAADLLAMAGEAFARNSDDVAAETQLHRALELDPRSTRALKGLSDVARRRGDWSGLERTLVSLADAADIDRDRVALRLAASRAALDAGALYRAKGHVDSVRKLAAPEEIAQLDAILQDARDNDRPISRSGMKAVNPAASPNAIAPVHVPASPPPPAPEPVATEPAIEAPLPAPSPADPDPISGPDRRNTPANWLAANPPIPRAIVPAQGAVDMPGADSEAAIAIPLTTRGSSARRAITPRPVTRGSPAPALAVLPPTPVDVASASEPAGYADINDEALRDAISNGDVGAMRALAVRLARTDTGREESLRLERRRYNADPTQLDALEAMVGLYHVLDRPEEARGVRSVLETLLGRESANVAPPLTEVPEPPPDSAARMTLPAENAMVGEVGTLLWEALGNFYKRDLAAYGVTGVDRISPTGPTDIARVYGAAGRVLQLARSALFVRAEVPGGAIPARTQPPAVILAAPLANDSAVTRYVLGQALESTRPSILLACALDADERATLVHAVTVGFGKGVMAGAPVAVAKMASELFAALTPRAQRRLQELIAELESIGLPFGDERWVQSAELSRARAGLIVSGDFGVSARMVVSRHRGGGEPDVRGALSALAPLRDLARFAVSEQYLMLRWQDVNGLRARR